MRVGRGDGQKSGLGVHPQAARALDRPVHGQDHGDAVRQGGSRLRSRAATPAKWVDQAHSAATQAVAAATSGASTARRPQSRRVRERRRVLEQCDCHDLTRLPAPNADGRAVTNTPPRRPSSTSTTPSVPGRSSRIRACICSIKAEVVSSSIEAPGAHSARRSRARCARLRCAGVAGSSSLGGLPRIGLLVPSL